MHTTPSPTLVDALADTLDRQHVEAGGVEGWLPPVPLDPAQPDVELRWCIPSKKILRTVRPESTAALRGLVRVRARGRSLMECAERWVGVGEDLGAVVRQLLAQFIVTLEETRAYHQTYRDNEIAREWRREDAEACALEARLTPLTDRVEVERERSRAMQALMHTIARDPRRFAAKEAP